MILLVIASLFLNQVVGNAIVGGHLIDINTCPWLVSIQKDDFHHCGGSIISESVVLTAAHCIRDVETAYTVRAGSTTTGYGGTLHKVVRIVKKHEQYVKLYGYNRILDDVALIKVSPAFQFNQNVAKIRLAEEGHVVVRRRIVNLAGWGSTSYDSSSSTRLKRTTLLTADSRDCAKAYGDTTGMTISSNNQICTYWDNRDACNGDSGGPLVDGGIQIGIVSSGVGCANSSYPGIYADLAHYRRWIDENSRFLERLL